jgi:hypothetical protein
VGQIKAKMFRFDLVFPFELDLLFASTFGAVNCRHLLFELFAIAQVAVARVNCGVDVNNIWTTFDRLIYI